MISRVCTMEMYAVKEDGFLSGETPEERFDHYVHLLQDPKNASDLLEKYDALASYLKTVTDQYISFFREFFSRFHDDRDLIYKRFLGDDLGFKLAGIQSSGDTHRNGRSVIILTFKKAGQTKKLAKKLAKKLVYKPRSLKIDEAFNALLGWVNEQQGSDLYVMDSMDRGAYGWCAYIDHLPCKNEADLTAFYVNAGNLLALLHLLTGSDIHSENLINFIINRREC